MTQQNFGGVYDYICRSVNARGNLVLPCKVDRFGESVHLAVGCNSGYLGSPKTRQKSPTFDMLYTLQDAPAAIDFTNAFWRTMVDADPGLQSPAPDTVGSARGDRFHLQWWTSPDGQHFAAQVLDTQEPSLWETFAIPTPSGPTVAGHRTCWGPAAHGGASSLQAIWETAWGKCDLEPLEHTRHPTFMDIVAAGTNPAGVTTVNDAHGLIAGLQADVQYWSGLAKALDKAKDERVGVSRMDRPECPIDQPQALVEAPRQWRLREIDVWAAQNTHRIIILPRAVSATKRSAYEAPEVLYACLELLAEEYRQVKCGQADRNAFKDKADALGITIGGSVDPSRAGMAGDQYFVRWRGARRFLEQHLAKGSSRDPRYCLRIYFTYCEVDQKVIVGSMPAHLDNSST